MPMVIQKRGKFKRPRGQLHRKCPAETRQGLGVVVTEMGMGEGRCGCRRMEKLKLTSGSMRDQKQSFLKDTIQRQPQNSQFTEV